MTWIQTHSGRAVDLLKPKPSQIYAGDIIHALSRLPRFTGHTVGPVAYTVAVHSVYTYRLALNASPGDTTAQLWALLHDAHETYVGDISTPLKQALGFRNKHSKYNSMVRRLDTTIAKHFGLTPQQLDDVHLLVKRCDLIALAAERAAYMSESERSWNVSWNADLPTGLPKVPVLKPCRPAAAEALFTRTLASALLRFHHGSTQRKSNFRLDGLAV